MTTYRSKIGAGIVIPIVIITGLVFFLMLLEKSWPGLLIVMGVLAFSIHLLATTYYQVDHALLKIRCGFLYKFSVPVAAIYKIEETNSLLSAPAASLDRLEVFYNKFDSVVISPKAKSEFIKHLLSLNAEIKVHLKK